MQNDHSIIIKLADIGGTTIVLDKEHYQKMVETTINDREYYERLARGPDRKTKNINS